MDAREQQAALERARQGDAEARGRLLESFRPYLRFMARTLHGGRLQGRLDDSDLIQDALLEAHRNFGSFRGGCVAELTGWLRQIALGVAHRAIRAHAGTGKRDLAREQPADGLAEQVADPGSSPSAQAIRHEQAARMAQAIARLPDDMQQVLLGRHLDGLPYAALAEQLGRTEGAVRVLYTRALRRVRELLNEQPGS
jgi:RNA polymerase sigma-70 factor (ECF subfamily)